MLGSTPPHLRMNAHVVATGIQTVRNAGVAGKTQSSVGRAGSHKLTPTDVPPLVFPQESC